MAAEEVRPRREDLDRGASIIHCSVRDDIGSMEKKVESIWVEIRNSKEKKSPIGVVYRPPNNDIMVGAKNQQINN